MPFSEQLQRRNPFIGAVVHENDFLFTSLFYFAHIFEFLGHRLVFQMVHRKNLFEKSQIGNFAEVDSEFSANRKHNVERPQMNLLGEKRRIDHFFEQTDDFGVILYGLGLSEQHLGVNVVEGRPNHTRMQSAIGTQILLHLSILFDVGLIFQRLIGILVLHLVFSHDSRKSFYDGFCSL